jgi:ribosome-associated toxin RatA of RatAB toxin-antitoxin module
LKHGQQQALIEASPQECFEAITDYETFPSWQDAVQSVEVVSRYEDGLGREVDFVVDAKVKKISYRLEYSYEAPSRIEWEYLGGDVRDIDGSMTFEERDEERTLVTYSVALDAGVWMPGPIRKMLSDQVMKRSVDDLKRRVESLTR